ncbi:hypothetical protein [Streptomyces sp. V3I7]|nr:hypothetical protein [Streptomyces sp. V3I7]MDQ0994773.1 hypothetical protein [Streptomyces sp. V3I7]
MSSTWTCGACSVPNVDRASCEAGGTSSPIDAHLGNALGLPRLGIA